MRKLFAVFGFLLVLVAGGEAKAVCTLPYVLQNGVLPDATQVMANFYALQACINTAASACSTNFPGLVPATGGVAGTFLRSDCTFAPAGGGSVVSVGLSVPTPSIFGVTGSPVTTTGALGLTTAGTFGGIPYFNSVSTLASSGQLAFDQLVVGGGPVAAPATPVGLGTATTVLHGNAGGPPNWGAVANADLATGGSVIINGIACTLGSSCSLGPRAQAFTSNGTHTVVATNEKVTVCGGGGGAGGNMIDSAQPGQGGGGGSGAVATIWLSGMTVGNTIAVVVGGPGTGGTFGQTGTSAATAGGSGGASQISSGSQTIGTTTANGGGGGSAGLAHTTVAGGTGGSATGGDINSNGANGDGGATGASIPGSGQAFGFQSGGNSGCGFGNWGHGGRTMGVGLTTGGSGENGTAGIVVFESG